MSLVDFMQNFFTNSKHTPQNLQSRTVIEGCGIEGLRHIYVCLTRHIYICLAILFLVIFSSTAFAQDGSLDNTFDSDGKVTTEIGNGDNGNHRIIIYYFLTLKWCESITTKLPFKES
jgi:hypothetical protein